MPRGHNTHHMWVFFFFNSAVSAYSWACMWWTMHAFDARQPKVHFNLLGWNVLRKKVPCNASNTPLITQPCVRERAGGAQGGMGGKSSTPFHCSAAIERFFFFSTASNIFQPRRTTLASASFDKLVFLKGNKYLLGYTTYKGKFEEEK